MRQTLFHIPHEILGWPLFGLGWALAAWCAFGIVLMATLIARQGWNRETRSYLPLLLGVAAAIWLVLPALEETRSGEVLGIPIRGYGTMVLLGVVSGVGLAVHESRRVGIDGDAIMSLAFWMFVFGILGARLFYVIQFWPQFQGGTVRETLLGLLNVTKGGLVVYGSVIGAVLAAIVFIRRRGLPMLAIADLVAPCMLLGLAFGRVGCLMNGCCYGGLCDVRSLAVTFPPEAPPYLRQLGDGRLHGIRLDRDPTTDEPVVEWIESSSPAAASGLRVGDVVSKINGVDVSSLDAAQRVLIEHPNTSISIVTAEGESNQWEIERLPLRSLPVHPTQVYSAINAAVLCLLLWSAYPFRRRDGQIFALMLTLYPVTRFLLESIRNDEPGRLGTPLTVSQIISVGLLVLAAFLWWYVYRGPRGTATPRYGEAARDSQVVSVK